MAHSLSSKLNFNFVFLEMEARQAVRRHMAAPERKIGKGGVPENLGVHAVVDVSAQVLAEFPRKEFRDAIRERCVSMNNERGWGLNLLWLVVGPTGECSGEN